MAYLKIINAGVHVFERKYHAPFYLVDLLKNDGKSSMHGRDKWIETLSRKNLKKSRLGRNVHRWKGHIQMNKEIG